MGRGNVKDEKRSEEAGTEKKEIKKLEKSKKKK